MRASFSDVQVGPLTALASFGWCLLETVKDDGWASQPPTRRRESLMQGAWTSPTSRRVEWTDVRSRAVKAPVDSHHLVQYLTYGDKWLGHAASNMRQVIAESATLTHE